LQVDEFAAGLGQRLIEAAGLGGVQTRGVGEHRAAVYPERGDPGVHAGQAGVPLAVDDRIARRGQGEQVGVLGRRQRPDEADRAVFDQGVVVGGVLPGVIHHGQRLHPASQLAVAVHQLADDGAELGDVRAVPGVGVGQQRDTALTGHHQRQPDQAQVGAFLLGLAPLRDRRLLIGRVDVGGEVGHVQHQPGQIQPELADHPGAQRGLDAAQVRLVQTIHRLPELAVVQHRAAQLHPPRTGGGVPPVRERQLRARRHDPVRRGQRDVGPDRGRRVTAPRDHRVDHPGHVQPLQHRPDRGQITEALVLAADRYPGRGVGQFGHHLRRAAQVLLGHDPRLAGDPRGLHQVVVRLVPLTLPHDRRHI
jgi:hypothetical protein